MKRAAEAFDLVADGYDSADASNPLRRWMRRKVRRQMLRHFLPGQTILEMNCGTGEDALFLARRGIHVVALDASEKMIAILRRKVAAEGLDERISPRVLANEALADLDECAFDGILSNFGGLNYVRDLETLSKELHRLTKPSAPFIGCVASRLCVLEILASAARGRFSEAFRRMVPERTRTFPGGTEVPVFFRHPETFLKAFGGHFETLELSGLGIFLPPPHYHGFYSRHPRTFALLERAEDRLRALFPFNRLGDHFVMEMRRRP